MNKLSNKRIPSWCPGCGTYSVSTALTQAISELKIEPKDVVLCYDIGCSGNMINVLDVCGVESLHGRSVPVAVGVKAVRPNLTVIAQAGDGGILNEGLNHLIHAIQRNDPITLIVNNNLIFGLTAGQKSSATPAAVMARGSASENEIPPLNIAELAAAAGAKFIARVTEEDIELIKQTFKEAIRFDGFALVEIIQPCKIWAKKFPKTNFKKIDKPFDSRLELFNNRDKTGILIKS